MQETELGKYVQGVGPRRSLCSLIGALSRMKNRVDSSLLSTEKLEAQIGEDEQRREALNWKLGEPAVYQDAERTRQLRSEHAELGAAIESLYREWGR